MSQFFTFAAQMLPKFEAKLQDAEANESKQVVMKCKINCTPRPTIQWFKNGQEITKDPRVKGYSVTTTDRTPTSQAKTRDSPTKASTKRGSIVERKKPYMQGDVTLRCRFLLQSVVHQPS